MVKSFMFSTFISVELLCSLQAWTKFNFLKWLAITRDWGFAWKYQMECRLKHLPPTLWYPFLALTEKYEVVCYDETGSKPIPHTLLFLGGLYPTAELKLARKQFSCIRKCDLCQAEVASLLALLFRCAVQINRYVKGSMHIPIVPCRLPHKSPECLPTCSLNFILISPPTCLLERHFFSDFPCAQVQVY